MKRSVRLSHLALLLVKRPVFEAVLVTSTPTRDVELKLLRNGPGTNAVT